MRYAVAFLGVVLFAATVASVLRSLVVPAGTITRISRGVDRMVLAIYHLAIKPAKSYETKNAVLASQPAAVLFVTLGVWATSFLFASAMLLWPVTTSFGNAIREAGASLVTLGFVSTNRPWATGIDFLTGFTGMIVVALQIAYLPTLYNAYNRRETEVTLLVGRAGRPAWGPEVLRRSAIGAVPEELPIIYLAWERWAAEVAETHISYPSLLRFRSPAVATSWIISFLAVLDAAALNLALTPSSAPMQARLCVQMGFRAMRQIAGSLKIPFDPDPMPNDPISVTLDEFNEAVGALQDAGFAIERSGEEAYRHFAGWRVNYEKLAYRLAYEIDAVPAPWSGSRRWKNVAVNFPTIINRTPERPNG